MVSELGYIQILKPFQVRPSKCPMGKADSKAHTRVVPRSGVDDPPYPRFRIRRWIRIETMSVVRQLA